MPESKKSSNFFGTRSNAAGVRQIILKHSTLNRTAIPSHRHKFEERAGNMPAFSPGRIVLASLLVPLMMTATPAIAGEALDGARLPWPLALPFAGILLSIALGPLVVKEWWHIHYEKAAGFWAILALGGLIAVAGFPAAAAGFVHSMALAYLPFILMLIAFYTAAGGIALEGRLNGSPMVNTTILAFGAAIANIIGTTGASMILVRPLIRANSARPFNAHVVVFFIFLVSTIGGVLTPLGNPPLFLGYLRGIDFFWTTYALWPQALFTVGISACDFFSRRFLFLPAGRKSSARRNGQRKTARPRPCEYRADGDRGPRHNRKRPLASGHRLRLARNKDRTAKPHPRTRHGRASGLLPFV